MRPFGIMVSPFLFICVILQPEGDEIIYSCFCASDDSVREIAVKAKRILFMQIFFVNRRLKYQRVSDSEPKIRKLLVQIENLFSGPFSLNLYFASLISELNQIEFPFLCDSEYREWIYLSILSLYFNYKKQNNETS